MPQARGQIATGVALPKALAAVGTYSFIKIIKFNCPGGIKRRVKLPIRKKCNDASLSAWRAKYV